MKIRVAVLDNDSVYLDRFVSAFSARYADKVELYSFTDPEIALNTLASNRIDVFVASENFTIDLNAIPSKCVFAYFVDSTGIDSFNNCSAICKFQKADLIYKQFLSLYSEKAGGISSLKLDDDSTKVIVFSSPCLQTIPVCPNNVTVAPEVNNLVVPIRNCNWVLLCSK